MLTAFQELDFAFKIKSDLFSLAFKDLCEGFPFHFWSLIQTQFISTFPCSWMFVGPCRVLILGLGNEEHCGCPRISGVLLPWTPVQEHSVTLKPEFWMQPQPFIEDFAKL